MSKKNRDQQSANHRSREREVVESDDDYLDDEEETPTTLPKSKKRKTKRRFPSFWLISLGLFLALVALAPTIVSLTPLGPRLVQSASKDRLNGSLSVESVGLGWFSGVSLRGVTLKDTQGETIAAVDSIQLEKSLVGLLSDQSQLGTLTITRPKLVLIVRPDGSNLEDALQPILSQPSSGGETKLPAITLQMNEGAVKLVDAVTRESWDLAPLTLQAVSPRGTEKAWLAKIDGRIGASAIMAEAAIDLATGGDSRVNLQSDRFPLDPLQPLLTRVLGPTELRGELTGKLEAQTADAGKRQQFRFEGLDLRKLQFASAKYLGTDRLQLQQCKAGGAAELVDGVWKLRDILIDSDVGGLAGSGEVRVSDFAGGAIPQSDCDVRGRVDLARLTRLLPNTLRVRNGVDIRSGIANVRLASRNVGDGRRYEAFLDTENLQAENNGRMVALKAPVKVEAAVTQTSQGWRIEKVDAKSSFLTADASGSPSGGSITLNGDLNRLGEELSQFIDLGEMKLAGKVDGVIGWKSPAADRYAAEGNLRLTDFELAAPGVMPWREEELNVHFQASDIASRGNAYDLGGAAFQVASAKDRLDITLRQGVANLTSSSPLPVNLELRGDLAGWLPRLQAFVPLAGWQVSGPILLTAQANAGLERLEVTEANLQLEDVRAAGNGIHIHEQIVKGASQFLWDGKTGTLTTSATTLQSTSFSILAEKLIVQTGATPRITGEVHGRGDVGKISSWFIDPQSGATSRFRGEIEAAANFAHEGGVTRAILNGEVAQLSFEQRAAAVAAPANNRVRAIEASAGNAQWQTMWIEPKVAFGGEAAYDAAKDAVLLNKMQMQAGTTAISANGAISQLASRCQLDLTGDVRYDLATWTPKVQPFMGPTFDMQGAAVRPYEVRGPLFTAGGAKEDGLLPLALTGKAGLNWTSSEWMAMKMGEGDLTAELKHSVLQIAPMKVPLSQGTVNLSPAVVLNGPTWYVSQSRTTLLDNVVITPEMCSTWLQYVAPLVANATQAQGRFSVDLENAGVPIFEPEMSDIKGDFVVHQVTVGPGPLAQSLIGTADKVKSFIDGKTGLDALGSMLGGAAGFGGAAPAATPPADPQTPKQWLQLPEQRVPVNVERGRVHHKDLTMQVKDLVIRTSGSVGIADQTLEMTAVIPILDAWIKDKRELQGLKGQSIEIPIGGTITRPVLDTRGLLTWGRNLAFAAGRGAVEAEMTKGLDKGKSAIGSEIQKGQNKVQEELNKGKQKIEDELRNGLKGIFGGS